MSYGVERKGFEMELMCVSYGVQRVTSQSGLYHLQEEPEMAGTPLVSLKHGEADVTSAFGSIPKPTAKSQCVFSL
ncbi:uncharacterized protein ANIA_11305 [Aspergillus nidulans FGSC A4]|uniref:Uncharacterized protein n=1 Tax=Emericella nidulans (strain FGSC A4 / ATCC 38163 / CBS 112.46 / NRRL 194 / M139) TaxID=227321 RepID=C8VMR5_EMENI|nr:hypothetical protein [Aspergillus nidulans FGSC A4]CBF85056.1 TPA: hypothetical protein ANIA_11305 [Aspergillus nidulans FGSC A4]